EVHRQARMSAAEEAAAPAPPAGTDHARAWAARADGVERVLGAAVDAVAALLLLVDIVLLGWAVTARYLLRQPVTAVEELAALIFLWFGMLGVASALRRGTHMRMSFVLARLPERVRARIEAASSVLLLIFLTRLIDPALELIALNHPVRSPDLSIPGSIAPLGTVISLVLMIIFLLFAMWRALGVTRFLACCAAAAAAIVALETAGPLLMPLGNVNLVLFFGLGVIVLIAMGIPIAFSFGI